MSQNNILAENCSKRQTQTPYFMLARSKLKDELVVGPAENIGGSIQMFYMENWQIGGLAAAVSGP